LVQELAVDVVEMSLRPHADHVADLIHEQALVLMLKDWRFNKFTARESQVMQECTLPQLSSRVVQLRRKIFPSLIDLSVQYLRYINFEEEQSSAREILIQSLDKVHNIDDLARVLNAHPDYEGILSEEVKDEIQKQLNFSQQLNSHPLVQQLLRENNELKKRLEGNTRMMRIDSMDSMSERVEEMTDANF
jgi:ribonuclease BN (tRNA processing enzyme)